jgi:predicted transcriptional regulator of viral defense system
MDIITLKSSIPTRYFDYQKLKSVITDQKNVRRFIGNLIKKNYIVRVKKGLYIWGAKIDNTLYSKEILSNLIYGPSYISLEYALSFYGLIPEKVSCITAISFKNKKNIKTPVGEFSYEYLNKQSYSHGLRFHVIDHQLRYLIATPEKALLDYIALRLGKNDLKKDLNDFLTNDLRFEMDDFLRLDMNLLRELSTYYKSSSIKKFIKLLQAEE